MMDPMWHKIQRRNGDLTPGYELRSPVYDPNSFKTAEWDYWSAKVPRRGYHDIAKVRQYEFGGECIRNGKLVTAVFRRRADHTNWATRYMTVVTTPVPFSKW